MRGVLPARRAMGAWPRLCGHKARAVSPKSPDGWAEAARGQTRGARRVCETDQDHPLQKRATNHSKGLYTPQREGALNLSPPARPKAQAIRHTHIMAPAQLHSWLTPVCRYVLWQCFAPPVPKFPEGTAALLEALRAWTQAEADAVRLEAIHNAEIAGAYASHLMRWRDGITGFVASSSATEGTIRKGPVLAIPYVTTALRGKARAVGKTIEERLDLAVKLYRRELRTAGHRLPAAALKARDASVKEIRSDRSNTRLQPAIGCDNDEFGCTAQDVAAELFSGPDFQAQHAEDSEWSLSD